MNWCGICFATGQEFQGPILCLTLRLTTKFLWLKKENRAIKGEAVKELLAMGMSTGLQFSITAIGSMVMQSANNGLGSTYIPAFTAEMKIKQFTMCLFDAIATSASVFCSQNLGAGQADRIKNGLFKQSCFLRRNRNDHQNSCLSWICRKFWIYCHLFRRPDYLDHSNLLYFFDIFVVYP